MRTTKGEKRNDGRREAGTGRSAEEESARDFGRNRRNVAGRIIRGLESVAKYNGSNRQWKNNAGNENGIIYSRRRSDRQDAKRMENRKKVFNKALYPREYEERLAEEKKEAEERERARAKLDIEALFENVEELAETGETAGSTEVEIKEAINYFTGEELAEMQKIANRAGERIKQERERKQSERKNGANGSK